MGIIAWGLTASITKEAIQRLRNKGYKVSAMYPKMVYPVPVNSIEKFASKIKTVIIPEANYQGQFAQLVKAKTNNVNPVKLNIYRGEPFIPKEIEDFTEKYLTKGSS